MKKRALAILMAALTATTMFAVPTFAADYSGEDPQLEKNIKILTIWAEDNDNGMLLNKICEDYQKNVNPNFTWEYEMVASDNLQQKIATLAASNDLPDLFAYEAGAPLSVLIDSGKVKNITEAVDEIGTADYLNSGAVELLKGLSGTDDLYDLPLGLNVEGFWYNKALFEQAGCEVPYTDEKLVAAADKIAEWAEKGYFGEGITTVDMNTAGSMLMNGKAAIFYNGSWFTQNLTDDSQNSAGEDGIGFFNIPVADESISSATSYSMNCGNILALDNDKYDEATGWFLKYFMENVGNVAMEEQGTVKGYTYDVAADDMDNYTKLVLDEIDKSTEGFAWWEAKMPSEISKTAQENVQPLLNGEMTGEEYMQSIQDVYDMQ